MKRALLILLRTVLITTPLVAEDKESRESLDIKALRTLVGKTYRVVRPKEATFCGKIYEFNWYTRCRKGIEFVMKNPQNFRVIDVILHTKPGSGYESDYNRRRNSYYKIPFTSGEIGYISVHYFEALLLDVAIRPAGDIFEPDESSEDLDTAPGNEP